MEGIIIKQISNIFYVEHKNNIYKCLSRGKFKTSDIKPVVGDYVKITKTNNEEAIIEEVINRKNYIIRPKMANLSQIIFVVSLNLPKPDLLLLDKQLAFSEYNKIKPIICLNKTDLDTKNNIADQLEKEYKKIGYKVIKTSAKDSIGIKELKKLLKNNTTAFSGNSGVGKSSLINEIFGQNSALEGEISLKNKKGKNTTTSTTLYKIDENSYIADTPGFSTFELNSISYKELKNYFIEIKKYESKCEYLGCSHILEENCEVKNKVKNGKIFSSRYENYKKIYEALKDKEEHKW